MAHAIEDLPPGPLDVYRKKASFNWKDMVFFLEGEEIYALKVNLPQLQSQTETSKSL